MTASPHPATSMVVGPTLGVIAEPATDRLVVHLHGEVDIATHDELTQRLDALDLTPYLAVELRLDQLDFCDSHGVRQLLAFVAATEATGRRAALVHPRPQLARLLALVAGSVRA